MEKQFPKNWVETELENLFNLVYGKGLSVSELTDEGYDVYGANGIIGKYKEYTYENSKVLISCRGAASGAIHKTKPKSYITSNSIVLNEISSDLINLDFVKYVMINTNKEAVITGTAQPQITIQLLKDLKIVLPPLPEQNRIVTKLDALFAQLETIKSSMANVSLLLKDFRQQVLTQAVTGKLTEEWRKGKKLENDFIDRIVNNDKRKSNINIPNGWLDLSFDSVVNIKSNLVNPNDYLDFPLITPDVIQSETGVLLSKPLVSDIMPISAKHYFSNGDIVYSKIRPYLSKLIIADFDGLCSADMYPISTDLDIKYLFYFMLSNEFLVFATTAGERSVLPKINQKGLNIIPIPTPSLQEQQEIVSRVESLFAKADAIEKQYENLKAKIDNLPQALLHKAFKGELTEQLASDGDARELLKEIEKLKVQKKESKKK